MAGPVVGCSFCGRPNVYPKHWVQGILVTINAERQIYRCRDCNREGMLLYFDTEEDRKRFEAECRSGTTGPG